MSLTTLLTVGATYKAKGKSGGYNLASISPRPNFNAAKPAAAAPVATAVLAARHEPIADAVERSQGSLFGPATDAAPLQRQTVRAEEVSGTQLQAGRSPSLLGVGSEGTTDLPASFPSLPENEKGAFEAKFPATVVETKNLSALMRMRRLMGQLFGHASASQPVASVQTELALENVTVVRNDLSDESWPGDSRSKSISDPTDTVGSWLNLTACFGKRGAKAEAAAKPDSTFVEGPEPGLVARV